MNERTRKVQIASVVSASSFVKHGMKGGLEEHIGG